MKVPTVHFLFLFHSQKLMGQGDQLKHHDVLVDHPGPLISESGIKTKNELLELSNKTSIKTFLIGESLLKNLDNNSIFSVI